MAQTLKFGNGNFATKAGSTLCYDDQNGNFKPIPMDFTRASTATRVNKEGLIEVVKSNVPRIDYTDTSDGVLLLEKAATNSLTQSNQFDTTWTNANSTVTSGQIGVGGSTNAWKLNANSGGGEKKIYVSASSGTQSLSVYAKKGTRDYLYLRGVTGNFNKRVYFNLSNGIIGTNESVSAEIFNMGNGWYRCNAVFNQDGGYEFQIGIAENDNGASYTDDGTGNIYIQYAQAETGNVASSYIPTQGSATTRVAETANGAGNSEVFNDSEGVLFADIGSFVGADNYRQITISDGSINNYILIGLRNDTGNIYFDSPFSSTFLTDVKPINSFAKCAFKYKVNDFSFWLNGFKVGVDTTTSVPVGLDTLNFDIIGVNDFYGKTKEIGYYDTILTDLELETLTSYKSWTSMVNELNLNIIYNG